MNRATMIRPILFAAAALAASLLAGPQTWAQPIVVYPTGDSSGDAVAIQNAINGASAGDTIVLKATNASGLFTPFNLDSTILSGRGTIRINKALTIKGESYRSSLSDRTVVCGGFATFFVDTLDPTTGAVDGPVNFAMLESRGAVYAFLNYKACNGASIADLTLLDVLPAFPSTIYPYGFANGISAENLRSDWFPPLYSQDKIKGDFLISRCRVEFPSNIPDPGSNCGIFFSACQANVTVSECQVYNMSAGIECLYSTGFAKIDKCDLMTNRIALGNGILRLSKGIAANVISGPVDISNNRVFIDGTQYNDVPVEILGVALLQDTGPITVRNDWILASTNKKGQSGAYGKHFIMDGNVTCSGNQLCGSSSFGFLIYGSNNTFEENDLSGLTTTYVGVYCSGNANVFTENIFGPHSSNWHFPVIWCAGNSNSFVHNDFRMAGVTGFNVSSNQVTRGGCVLLDNGTSGNVVDATWEKLTSDTGPQYDPWTQIVDLAFGSNTVNLEGTPAVWSNQYDQLLHMLSQNEEYRERKAEIDAKLAEQLKMIEGW
jgi:hypothetical protein